MRFHLGTNPRQRRWFSQPLIADPTQRNGGVIQTAGVDETVSPQTIVGGTGDFVAASGVMTAVSTSGFAGGGRSEHAGVFRVPGMF